MKVFIALFMTLNVFAEFNPSSEYATTVDSLLSIQEEVLSRSEDRNDNRNDKAWGDWELSGQKTDLAISKSGILGFSAVKGTSAVELSWSRKSSSKELNIERTDVRLDSSMSEDMVLNTVRPTFKLLFKNSKKSIAHIQKNMEDHIIRYHRALKGIYGMENSTYSPKKFRLDLSTSFSSPLFGFTKLSGDTRMRLEWKISPLTGKSNREEDQEVVSKLMEDLSRALESTDTNSDYKLKEISIGLGLSQKNLLSFSNVKGEIVGELYFKKNSQKVMLNEKDLEGEYSLKGEEKILNFFKRRKFRKGITKAYNQSVWFANQFKGRSSGWEIKKFKTSYSLSYSGFLGLANTSSKGLVTMTYSK